MGDARGDDWTLTFRAEPDRVPAAVRLRRLLKFALRGLGLRCVRIETPPKEEEERAGTDNPQPPGGPG